MINGPFCMPPTFRNFSFESVEKDESCLYFLEEVVYNKHIFFIKEYVLWKVQFLTKRNFIRAYLKK